MAKRTQGRSKKGMPKDLKRITNASGKRVWVTGGREYATLAEVGDTFKTQR